MTRQFLRRASSQARPRATCARFRHSLAAFAATTVGLLALSTSAYATPIFSSGFELASGPVDPVDPGDGATGGPITFQNVTINVIPSGQLFPSSNHFDAMWTDFNGDGCPDAFILEHSTRANSRLWVNRCDGSNKFDYVDNNVAHYALPGSPEGSGWVTLVDHNGDGRQDFWLRNSTTRYVNGTPPGQHLPVFVDKMEGCHDGDGCLFADIDNDGNLDVIGTDRRATSLHDNRQVLPAASRYSRAVIGDINNDGWPDIVHPKLGGYWQNQAGQMVWRDVPALKGRSYLMTLADFDNDGWLDLFTFDVTECNEDNNNGKPALFRNDRNGGFVDVTAGSGVEALTFVSCQTNYGNVLTADLDNDGRQDLVVAGSNPRLAVLQNLGGFKFALVPGTFGSSGYKDRVAVADYDNDGRLDLIKTQSETNVGIWRNTTASASMRWMKARVRGPGTNVDGIGADLRWYRTGSTELVAHLQVQATDQHAQTWLHTGVGENQRVDLVVRMPGSRAEYRYNNLDSNQEVIVFANGCLMQNWTPGQGWPMTAPSGCSAP
ncbi:MAG: VCBS repeat-containing protein [Dokdonella sp.]